MKILGTFFLAILINNVAYSNRSALDEIQRLATQKKISEMRSWIKLLHIEKNVLGMKRTQINDGDFFLSKNHSDPRLELMETLSAFTRPKELYEKEILNNKNEKIIDHSEHPICKYPARLHFLQNELSDDDSFWQNLPKVNCTFQNIFLHAIDVKSISFVFSSYYSDSPGSAFGHTFFRINRKSNKDKQELLDYGVGFAADVNVSNPIVYALLGLVGGFNGSWTNLPYYYKVREYNDFESRDLWSYDLNLTDEEVKMFSYHLWEIGDHKYTYFFFTQNCAFHMLTTLEAAAPRLHLIDHVPFLYVIPSDSMKSLFFEKDLVLNVSFRPSLKRVFNERLKNLDNFTLDEFKKFSSQFELPQNLNLKSPEQNAALMDSAIDLINLKFPNATEIKNPKIFELKEKILINRSKVDYISKPIVLKTNDYDRPDKSHGSSRFSTSYRSFDSALGLDYRFALHDLLDSTVGLPEYSQLEFVNINLKKKSSKFYLDNLNLFKVLNLNPINFYEKKFSWGLKLGTRRFDDYTFKTKTFYSTGIESQLGYSADLNIQQFKLTSWSMLRLDLGLADKEKNNQFGYGAIGYQVGLLERFNESFAILLYYEKMFPNKLPQYEKINLESRYAFNTHLSIGLGLDKKYLKTAMNLYY
jgi:signal peptidase I